MADIISIIQKNTEDLFFKQDPLYESVVNERIPLMLGTAGRWTSIMDSIYGASLRPQQQQPAEIIPPSDEGLRHMTGITVPEEQAMEQLAVAEVAPAPASSEPMTNGVTHEATLSSDNPPQMTVTTLSEEQLMGQQARDMLDSIYAENEQQPGVNS